MTFGAFRVKLARLIFAIYDYVDPPMRCTECGERECYNLPFARCSSCDETYTCMTNRLWRKLEVKGNPDGS